MDLLLVVLPAKYLGYVYETGHIDRKHREGMGYNPFVRAGGRGTGGTEGWYGCSTSTAPFVHIERSFGNMG
jgi:hypothetical protein